MSRTPISGVMGGGTRSEIALAPIFILYPCIYVSIRV